MGKVKLYIVSLLAVSMIGLTIINLEPQFFDNGSTISARFVHYFKSLSVEQALIGAATTGTLTVLILFGLYKLKQFQLKQ